MRIYETTFIINPQTDDAVIDKNVKDVASIITSNNGKIHHEDFLGTRRLAYDILGLTHGYYASFIFEGPTELMPLLDKHFKLNEAYIRNLTVVFEGDLEKIVKPSEDTQAFDAKKSDKAEKTEAAPEATPAVEKSSDDKVTLDDEVTTKIEVIKEAETKTEEAAPEKPASDEDEL